MRRFAIFLSSETYLDYPKTEYCHTDSDNLKNILVARCDYPKENILQLKLSPDADMGAGEIIKEIEALLGRSEAGDSILFFYAGHGQAINGESYLILPSTRNFDAATSSLALRDIHHYLSGNQRVNIRIFDCCHSGENIRAGTLNLNTEEFVTSILKDGGDGTITFSSCAINEKSYADDDLKQGVFTSALVQAIGSVPDTSPVYIENLKLDVCARVQKWSEERSKKQTPTLTMHVNGNMPIAFTKKTETPRIDLKLPADLTFEERLSRLRAVEVVNEEFYPQLTETINLLEQEMLEQTKDFDYYGMRLATKPISDCESIPSKVEERIVLNMKDENTMHEMEVVRKKRPDNGMYFAMSSFFRPPPEYDVFYHLTQSSSMPNCYLEAELKNDRIAPASRIFLYVCPLQVTVAIIGGYYFNVGYNSDENLRVIMLPPKIFSLQAIRNHEYTNIVDSLVQSFKGDLHAEMLNRLKALEKEMARLK